MNNILEGLLSNLCLDERVSDGIFDISNNDHMEAMREYLVKKGITEEMAVDFSNTVLEAGKYPERQAYNKNGILVTFPTPQHKQNAIRRGTHFEKDPTKGRPNLFDPETGEKKRGPGRPPKEDGEKDKGKFTSASQGGGQVFQSDAGATSLPTSGTDTNQSPDSSDTSTTTSAPEPDGEEPAQETPSDMLPPKPPEEKEQDKKAISRMIANKNTSLGSPLGSDAPPQNKPVNKLDIAKNHLREAIRALDEDNQQ